jgi:hypothetical protein
MLQICLSLFCSLIIIIFIEVVIRGPVVSYFAAEADPGGSLHLEHVFDAAEVLFKRQHIGYRNVRGEFLDGVVGADIGECPARRFHFLHQFLDGIAVILLQSILFAVGKNCDQYVVVLLFLKCLSQTGY